MEQHGELILGVVVAIFSSGVVYGILNNRVDNMERQMSERKERLDKLESALETIKEQFITQKHFDAMIQPLKDGFREVAKDVKKLLVIHEARELNNKEGD